MTSSLFGNHMGNSSLFFATVSRQSLYQLAGSSSFCSSSLSMLSAGFTSPASWGKHSGNTCLRQYKKMSVKLSLLPSLQSFALSKHAGILAFPTRRRSSSQTDVLVFLVSGLPLRAKMVILSRLQKRKQKSLPVIVTKDSLFLLSSAGSMSM